MYLKEALRWSDCDSKHNPSSQTCCGQLSAFRSRLDHHAAVQRGGILKRSYYLKFKPRKKWEPIYFHTVWFLTVKGEKNSRSTHNRLEFSKKRNQFLTGILQHEMYSCAHLWITKRGVWCLNTKWLLTPWMCHHTQQTSLSVLFIAVVPPKPLIAH